jgi:ParB family transcriptional regulator, chromosome partitioning protein
VSSPRRIGLPETLRMRHDPHFVDQLVRPSGEPIGRMLAVSELDPNPRQPRQSLGDLSELAASIKEKGVLEPILVRRVGDRYQIVAGERRYRAAIEAGLEEVPCILRDASDAETMELALVENLQRKDLTPFEEADGLKSLADRYGYTHEKMAEMLGKSRSSITEALSLTQMPEQVRELCRLADIGSKSLLLQIVRQETATKMTTLVEQLQSEGAKSRQHARSLARHARGKGRGRPRNYVFRFQPAEKTFSLALQFRKSHVPREEVVRALQAILDELTRGR